MEVKPQIRGGQTVIDMDYHSDSFRGTPLYRYGYGSVLFFIVFTIVLGILFAPFSYGFLYFFFLWVLWIIAYSFLVKWKYPNWRLFIILGIFCTGLTGFIIGRILCGDDTPLNPEYD